ncbi:hypothetical protein B566_EDAN015308 [Ephemera danica]|nr:hypothetical protein B566_EDAN015308 [Ephemera danica]
MKMFILNLALIFSTVLIVSGHGVLQVLLLGGNGFIGSHLTLALLSHQSRLMNITMVSRGNWPFDTDKTIEPYVFHIPCDRYDVNGLRGCPEFMNIIKHIAFDCVVDFSAYEPNVLREALLVLKQKAGIYIYISSDSIYEVSEPSNSTKSREEDGIRPHDPELYTKLAEADSYGDEKFQGEDVLTSQEFVPYIIFRLPDVMGERDGTKRWWFYTSWLQHYQAIGEPLPIPSHLENVKTSYVYAPDVGTLIADIILGRFTSDINNQIFNLAFEDGVTLKELLLEMSSNLETEIEFQVKDNAVFMLPSVTRGPVDISKAKKYLNFKPTDWRMALRKTIYFYKKANMKFPKERDQVVDKLIRLAVPDDKKEKSM